MVRMGVRMNIFSFFPYNLFMYLFIERERQWTEGAEEEGNPSTLAEPDVRLDLAIL